MAKSAPAVMVKTEVDALFERQRKFVANRPGGQAIPLPDLDDLERLCTLNPTMPEIAAFFKVSLRTANRWQKNKAVKEIIDRGRQTGKLSVRREQLRLLEAGDKTMAVWLGKVLLGQREPLAEVKHSGNVTLTKRLVGVDIDKI